MTPLTQLLEKVERAEAAASEGPWTAHDNHGTRYVSNGKDGRYAKFDNRVCEAAFNLHLEGKSRSANMDWIAQSRTWLPLLVKIVKVQKDALEKVSDPRKRDHKEPDSYTELGCVMNIADAALRAAEELAKRNNG